MQSGGPDGSPGSFNFPCAPGVRTEITTTGRDSTLPGGSVGPEPPGDHEQSKKPR